LMIHCDWSSDVCSSDLLLVFVSDGTNWYGTASQNH
jgi:hypothetical protein